MEKNLGQETWMLDAWSRKIKKSIEKGRLQEAKGEICSYMGRYPDSAVPHNLYAVLCEKQGEHVKAMNHLRAARDLEPEYWPAEHNLNLFGTEGKKGRPAYSISERNLFTRVKAQVTGWGQSA